MLLHGNLRVVKKKVSRRKFIPGGILWCVLIVVHDLTFIYALHGNLRVVKKKSE